MNRWMQLIVFATSVMIVLGIALFPANAQDGDGPREPRPGNRLFFDDFLTFVNQWQRAEEDAYQVNYASQALRFDMTRGGVQIASRPGTARVFDDAFIEVSLNYQTGSARNSSAGIQFGFQDIDNFYVFNLRPSGHYEVRLRQNGEWDPEPLVIGYRAEVAENPLETYHLRISYDSGLYMLWLDDQPLTPFYNDALGAGEFGLYAQSGNGPASVIFDDFAVYDLVYDEAVPESDQMDIENDTTPVPLLEPTQVPQSERSPTAPTPLPTEEAAPDEDGADNGDDVVPPRI